MRSNLLLSLFLATTVLFTASCKKDPTDSTNTDYYVKIKKNGAWINYAATAGELGPDLLNATLTDLGVSAHTANNNEIFNVTIQVKGTTFPLGTYNSDNSNYQTVMSLTLLNGTNMSNYDIDDAPGMAPSKYTINITSITTDAITGTFTGNYLYDGFSGTTVTTITEGQFHVKRIR